jgi:hypothetical protein
MAAAAQQTSRVCAGGYCVMAALAHHKADSVVLSFAPEQSCPVLLSARTSCNPLHQNKAAQCCCLPEPPVKQVREYSSTGSFDLARRWHVRWWQSGWWFVTGMGLIRLACFGGGARQRQRSRLVGCAQQPSLGWALGLWMPEHCLHP